MVTREFKASLNGKKQKPVLSKIKEVLARQSLSPTLENRLLRKGSQEETGGRETRQS